MAGLGRQKSAWIIGREGLVSNHGTDPKSHYSGPEHDAQRGRGCAKDEAGSDGTNRNAEPVGSSYRSSAHRAYDALTTTTRMVRNSRRCGRDAARGCRGQRNELQVTAWRAGSIVIGLTCEAEKCGLMLG